MRLMVIVHGVGVKGAKDKRSKYIKVSRVLDMTAEKYDAIKEWVMVAPGVYLSEGRMTVAYMKRVKSFLEEKLGKDIIVLAVKNVTDLAKDLELMRKAESEREMEVMGTKYISEVREFGGSYYISLPKSIAKTIGVKKGDKVIVRVTKA